MSSVLVDTQDWNKEEVQAREENLATPSIYLAQVVFKTFYEAKNNVIHELYLTVLKYPFNKHVMKE